MTLEYKKSTFDEIANVMLANDNFVICGHVNSDGDCISSQAALEFILESKGKKVVNLLADKDSVDPTLEFLPFASSFVYAKQFDVNEHFGDNNFVFISVDVPMLRRIGKYAPSIKQKANLSITIDHHEPEDLDSNYVYCDSTAASASLLVWELSVYFDKNLHASKDLATCCLCGLISDTGSFRYQNADKRCFSAAAEMVSAGADPAEISKNLFQNRTVKSLLMESRVIQNMQINKDMRFAISFISEKDFEEFNATKEDADFMVDMLRSINCVDVVCILRQEKSDQDIHGSLRSKTDLDVSKVARQYVGGGHKAAAGFTMKSQKDMSAAIKDVELKIMELCSNEERNN